MGHDMIEIMITWIGIA